MYGSAVKARPRIYVIDVLTAVHMNRDMSPHVLREETVECSGGTPPQPTIHRVPLTFL